MKRQMKNLLNGMSSIFDISGYNNIKIKSDYESIKFDWEIIGKDLWSAIKSKEEEK